MNNRLNYILLIDDDEPTNFINKYTITKKACAHKVIAIESAETALQFLKERQSKGQELPALIFLDINMPAMNGWEFLEAFKKMKCNLLAEVTIVMLTTSFDPEDKEKARQILEVKDFVSKPLSSEKLHQVLENHFPKIMGNNIRSA